MIQRPWLCYSSDEGSLEISQSIGGDHPAKDFTYIIGLSGYRIIVAVKNDARWKTWAEVAAEAKKAGQWGFWKVPAEVAGPGGTIPFPKRVTYFDYEGEVAIVIGKRGKNIPASKVNDYVWGVTLFHDWSIRDGGGYWIVRVIISRMRRCR